VSNAQINSISGTISTAQKHAKAHVKDVISFLNALSEEPEKMAFRTETIREICNGEL